MRLNYKKVWKYISHINNRNRDLKVSNLLWINIDKFFMPSVANIIWTDMSNYKIVKKWQFACNRMHVWRDMRLPVALSKNDEDFIVSPAYDVFEIIDEKELLPEYLMMWFSRKEFDRNAWFYTDADVRQWLHWDAFCNIDILVPDITKQEEIVDEYNVIKNRMNLNNNLINKLEETAQAIYKQWFVDFEFPDENGNPYKSSGWEMEFCSELEKEVPKRWRVWKIWDYSKVKSWFAFKSENWTNEWIPVIKIWSISNNTIDFSSLDYVDYKIWEKELNNSAKEWDVVIAMTWATIWKIWLVPKIKDYFLVNQRVWLFDLGNNPLSKAPYLYMILLDENTQNEIMNVWWDSAQANISNIQIEKIKIIFWGEKIINNFNNLLFWVFRTISNKNSENENLWKMKDLILSKMASGS